jgi:hypothetical protein
MGSDVNAVYRCGLSLSVLMAKADQSPRSMMHVAFVKVAADGGITFGLFLAISFPLFRQTDWGVLGAWGMRQIRSSECHSTDLSSRYHSVDDKRIPQKFICFDCRARADVSWELIKTDLYPQMLSKFRQLALFRYQQLFVISIFLRSYPFDRRAIKIVETTKAETPTEFGKKIGRVPYAEIFSFSFQRNRW